MDDTTKLVLARAKLKQDAQAMQAIKEMGIDFETAASEMAAAMWETRTPAPTTFAVSHDSVHAMSMPRAILTVLMEQAAPMRKAPMLRRLNRFVPGFDPRDSRAYKAASNALVRLRRDHHIEYLEGPKPKEMRITPKGLEVLNG